MKVLPLNGGKENIKVFKLILKKQNKKAKVIKRSNNKKVIHWYI